MDSQRVEVRAYPVCRKCKTPWILRRASIFAMGKTPVTTRVEWIWQRDCKCRNAEADVAQETGA